jgi:putative Ca2+/H+ antiporter (TMEM165/GDT1 family)
VSLAVLAAVAPLVALAELPDKTMFASLILASRGRPAAVWCGAAGAFALHVVIAVSVGQAVFALLPHRLVDVVVALAFAAGAVYAWRERGEDEEVAATAGPPAGVVRTATTAAGVIFVAEWGDLTQILTANLAARYHDALSVGAGALLGLWLVAGVAVVSGSGLLRVLSARRLRSVTAVVLTVLAVWSAVGAVRA